MTKQKKLAWVFIFILLGAILVVHRLTLYKEVSPHVVVKMLPSLADYSTMSPVGCFGFNNGITRFDKKNFSGVQVYTVGYYESDDRCSGYVVCVVDARNLSSVQMWLFTSMPVEVVDNRGADYMVEKIEHPGSIMFKLSRCVGEVVP